MITRLTALCALGLGLCGPASAQSLGTCAPHATMVEHLMTGYGESRQSIAISADNMVVETYASLETGTWTIIVTAPGGPSCLVAAGQAFQLTGDNSASLDPEA